MVFHLYQIKSSDYIELDQTFTSVLPPFEVRFSIELNHVIRIILEQ